MQHSLKQMAEALRIASHAIDAAQRGTGRTYRMLEQVRDGDAILCHRDEAGCIRQELRRRNIRADVRVIAPTDFLQGRVNLYRGQKRTHFSHVFTQAVIEQEIMDMAVRLERRFNEINAKPRQHEFVDFRDRMMAPNPILDDLSFVPVSAEPSTFSELAMKTFNEQ
ncbi:hypothetical protein GOC13_07425 [Sinorhizobium meliloti]|nr:hypothetical protein [Sinorhizobium meliloti]